MRYHAAASTPTSFFTGSIPPMILVPKSFDKTLEITILSAKLLSAMQSIQGVAPIQAGINPATWVPHPLSPFPPFFCQVDGSLWSSAASV